MIATGIEIKTEAAAASTGVIIPLYIPPRMKPFRETCVVCDAKGQTIAQAHHTPSLLAGFEITMRELVKTYQPEALEPGDVIVTNDPYRGGSHLPDVTVVTPVFDTAGSRLLFFTASRAHHAEIGGIVPGSMPPFSRTLAEEGVVIRHFRLVQGQRSSEAALAALVDFIVLLLLGSALAWLAAGRMLRPIRDTTELARRTGLLAPYNAAINRGAAGVKLSGPNYDFSLDPARAHSVESIWDATCRAASAELTDGAETHGLDWFRTHGFRVKPFSRLMWYLYPKLVEQGLNLRIGQRRVAELLQLGEAEGLLRGQQGGLHDFFQQLVHSLLLPCGIVYRPAISMHRLKSKAMKAALASAVCGSFGPRFFISVPTAASHDGIVSARASVPMEEGSASLAAHPPIAIVADTGIIASSPHRLTASGCADIISNWTACLDWELANRLKGEQVSDYAIALSRMTAELLKKNTRAIRPHSEEGAWIVIKALVSSGVAMSIAGSSRPGSGGEHKFGHALEKLIPGKALHGEACGIGTIISMYLHGGDWRGIREALKYIGAPVTPGDLGIPDEVAVEALIAARHIRPERFTIIDMGITRESAEKLIRMLYED